MDRLLRMPDVVKASGLRPSTIYAHIKQGKFPPPRKLGRSSGWKESEVQQWIDSREVKG